MLNLTINGHQAVLMPNSSFTLVRTNPYFEEERGDYTFDVQLPLEGCAENWAIFGTLHRPEYGLSHLTGKRFPMQLVAPPISLTGYAEIRSITSTAVKVQLVAGRSALGRAVLGDSDYIDELNLGVAWDEFPPFDAYVTYEDMETYYPGTTAEEMKKIFNRMPEPVPGQDKGIVKKMAFGQFGETDCVAFPVFCPPVQQWPEGGYVEQYAANPNPWTFMKSFGTGSPQPSENDQYHMSVEPIPGSTGMNWKYTQLAPQPYLFDILPRVFTALGYQLTGLQKFTNTWLRGLFVANYNPDMKRAHTLPHWTAHRFFHSIERFLGAIFVTDGHNVSLLPVDEFYLQSSSASELHDILDEWTVELQEEESAAFAGTSAANIGYQWGDDMDDMRLLPDEVWERAKRKEYPNLSVLQQQYAALSDDEKAMSSTLYTVTSGAGKGTYASLHDTTDDQFKLIRVNQAGPYIGRADGRDLDVELDIVPAGPGLSVAHSYGRERPYNINEVINPATAPTEEDPSPADERDVLELAHYDGRSFFRHKHNSGAKSDYPMAVGFPWFADENNGLPSQPDAGVVYRNGYPEDGVFSLENNDPQSIGAVLRRSNTIKATAEHCYDFLDNIDCDPTISYYIRGKRYACHKIELTIDENGVRPRKKGYFFELK